MTPDHSFRVDLERLWDSISHFAAVETPGGRTTVSWGGDLTTVIQDPKQYSQHVMALDDALSRRQAALQVVAECMAVVSTAALASTNPLAVPAAMAACQRLGAQLRAARPDCELEDNLNNNETAGRQRRPIGRDSCLRSALFKD